MLITAICVMQEIVSKKLTILKKIITITMGFIIMLHN